MCLQTQRPVLWTAEVLKLCMMGGGGGGGGGDEGANIHACDGSQMNIGMARWLVCRSCDERPGQVM